jgi:hypothetical protein
MTSKNKYLQISEAYQKLNSVMEGSDGYKGDDTHEVAAFMRMFMDMVGISESDSIPAGERRPQSRQLPMPYHLLPTTYCL